MELNQISLGIASLAGNSDFTVATAINRSLSGVLQLSHLMPSPLGKHALLWGKLRENGLCLSGDSPRN